MQIAVIAILLLVIIFTPLAVIASILPPVIAIFILPLIIIASILPLAIINLSLARLFATPLFLLFFSGPTQTMAAQVLNIGSRRKI